MSKASKNMSAKTMNELVWARLERMSSLALVNRLVWLLWGLAIVLLTWGKLLPTISFIWVGYYSNEYEKAHLNQDISMIEIGDTLATSMLISAVAYGVFKALELILHRYDESELQLRARRKSIELTYKQRLEAIEALESIETLLAENAKLRLELTTTFEYLQRIKLEAEAVKIAKTPSPKCSPTQDPLLEPDLLSFANKKNRSPTHWRTTSKPRPKF